MLPTAIPVKSEPDIPGNPLNEGAAESEYCVDDDLHVGHSDDSIAIQVVPDTGQTA